MAPKSSYHVKERFNCCKISIALTVVLERFRSRSDLASFAAPDSSPDPDTISRRLRSQLGGRLIALCDAY